MRYTSLPIHPTRPNLQHAVFRLPRPRFGAEQRDSLCRGVVFFLVLALSSLLIVYAPVVWGDPGWTAAGAPQPHAGAATIVHAPRAVAPR